MSPEANDLAARHFQVRRSITAEQWAVIEREQLCDRASDLKGKSPREILYAIFEREAKDQQAN